MFTIMVSLTIIIFVCGIIHLCCYHKEENDKSDYYHPL